MMIPHWPGDLFFVSGQTKKPLGRTLAAYIETPDRWRQKAEPLRDWRRSSVLLHMLFMTLANAIYWSLCRNDDRKLIFCGFIESRSINHTLCMKNSKVDRLPIGYFIADFHQKIAINGLYRIEAKSMPELVIEFFILILANEP